jgi:hypothetical protein
MGRPPMKPEHKRSERFVLQLTADEKERIFQIAADLGYTTASEYIRAAALGDKTPE